MWNLASAEFTCATLFADFGLGFSGCCRRYVLSGISDEVPSVQEAALEIMIKIGKQ